MSQNCKNLFPNFGISRQDLATLVTMVIRMTDSSNNKSNSQQQLRRTAKMRSTNASNPIENGQKNTKAEFKRLKTILPSIRRKENVSKLDIILEAIKYIDDLQDQLFDRLTGTHSQREATLLALTEQDMERSRARLNQLRNSSQLESSNSETDSEIEMEEEECLNFPPNSSSSSKDLSDDDNGSHASLEL